MKQILMMRGANKLVRNNAVVKAGEEVLIVTDPEMVSIARTLATVAYGEGAETVMAIMPPREFDSQEPPETVAAAMKMADVIFTPVIRSITHTRAIHEACAAGARAIVMTAFTEDLLISGGIEADFQAQKPICEKVAQLLGEAKTARLTSAAGTDLTMNLTGRRGGALTGIADKPGLFTTVPTIEANVSPVEYQSEGTIVVDASIPYWGIGLLEEPITLTVKGGLITDIYGGRQAQIMREVLEKAEDPKVYNVAELGIQLNPKCKMCGSMLEDEGVFGCIHIGIGSNTTFGGSIQAALHFDLIIWYPRVELDGKVLLDKRQLQI